MNCNNCNSPILNDKRKRRKYCSKSCQQQMRTKVWRAKHPIIKGDTLINITNGELLDLKNTTVLCAICKQPETISTINKSYNIVGVNKLTADHNHETKEFRGLLCQRCNSMLGWYDNYKAQVDCYLGC